MTPDGAPETHAEMVALNLRAAFDELAWQHAETVDGEWACCHDREAMKDGKCSGFPANYPDQKLAEIVTRLAGI